MKLRTIMAIMMKQNIKKSSYLNPGLFWFVVSHYTHAPFHSFSSLIKTMKWKNVIYQTLVTNCMSSKKNWKSRCYLVLISPLMGREFRVNKAGPSFSSSCIMSSLCSLFYLLIRHSVIFRGFHWPNTIFHLIPIETWRNKIY